MPNLNPDSALVRIHSGRLLHLKARLQNELHYLSIRHKEMEEAPQQEIELQQRLEEAIAAVDKCIV